MLLLGISCPIRRLTGVPCPGCGMTRACLGLVFGEPTPLMSSYADPTYGIGLWGNIRYAMHFHPLVLVIPPLLIYAFFGKKPLLGSHKRELGLLCAAGGLMILTYVVRLVLRDPILAMDIRQGVLTQWLLTVFGK